MCRREPTRLGAQRSEVVIMIRFIILVGAAAVLGACHVPPPVYVIQGPPEKVTANGPPPEARLEVPSVAP